MRPNETGTSFRAKMDKMESLLKRARFLPQGPGKLIILDLIQLILDDMQADWRGR